MVAFWRIGFVALARAYTPAENHICSMTTTKMI
jgi:hypothetical protein